MLLTRHQTSRGPRWAADNRLLAELFDLRMLLAMPREDIRPFVEHTQTADPVSGSFLAPLEMTQEVWLVRNPDRLAAPQRPALFFKSIGWRAVGRQHPICQRCVGVGKHCRLRFLLEPPSSKMPVLFRPGGVFVDTVLNVEYDD